MYHDCVMKMYHVLNLWSSRNVSLPIVPKWQIVDGNSTAPALPALPDTVFMFTKPMDSRKTPAASLQGPVDLVPATG
jgi:hypothetical protein